MAERQFFNLRYGIPGYSFVVFLLFPFMDSIAQLLGKLGISDLSSSASVLLGVVALLAGPPIGFLISQPRYIINHSKLKDGLSFVKMLKEDIFNVGPETWKVVTVSDFILHNCDVKGIVDYLDRRLDLKNLFGAEFVAIEMGTVVGVILKIGLGLGFSFVDAGIVGLSMVTSLILYSGYRTVSSEQQRMADRVTLEVLKGCPELLLGFDKTYFVKGVIPKRQKLLDDIEKKLGHSEP